MSPKFQIGARRFNKLGDLVEVVRQFWSPQPEAGPMYEIFCPATGSKRVMGERELETLTTPERLFVRHVYLTADEWGTDLMTKVADEYFAETLLSNPWQLLYVHEHAGWALGFARVGGRVRVVASANDAAVYSPEVQAFRSRTYSMPREDLPEIRRPAKGKGGAADG